MNIIILVFLLCRHGAVGQVHDEGGSDDYYESQMIELDVINEQLYKLEQQRAKIVSWLDRHQLAKSAAMLGNRRQNSDDDPVVMDALGLFYVDLHGRDWKSNYNWFAVPYVSYCSGWVGITCDAATQSVIISLNLTSNNLRGSVLQPGILANIGSSLQIIDLSDNFISGNFPWVDLQTLVNLVFLNISYTTFGGSIPAEHINTPTMLQHINLGQCAFSGPLPSIVSLANLTYFNIRRNEITGTIGAMPENIQYLALQRNKLTGTIPTELGLLTGLTHLYLNFNNISGTIPSEFGSLTNLLEIAFQSMALTGTIPTELFQLTKLQTLELSNNALSSTLPTLFGLMQNLIDLNLEVNEFSGAIPSELGLLVECTYFDLMQNNLSSTIPSELGLLTNVVAFELGSNNLNGTLPLELANLTLALEFQCQQNRLTGPLLHFIGTRATLLDFGDNFFTGTIPASYTDFHDLEALYLNSNFLTGVLPPGGYSMWKSLRVIDLSDNLFNASLTAFLCDWWGCGLPLSQRSDGDHKLITLKLDHNNFHGSIPDELSFFTTIETLSLSSNNLSGTLPPLFYTPSWVHVDVSDNFLSGSITEAWIRDLVDLEVLNITGTNMRGDLPNDYLLFSAGYYYQALVVNVTSYYVMCPTVLRNTSTEGYFSLVMDPIYHSYSGCICPTGFYGLLGKCFLCDDWCTCKLTLELLGDSNSSSGRSNSSDVEEDYLATFSAYQLLSVVDGCYPVYSLDEGGNKMAILNVLPCPRTNQGEPRCRTDPQTWHFDCLEGYEDKQCTHCSNGYYGDGPACHKCRMSLAWFYVALNFVAFCVLIFYLHSKSMTGSETGTVKILFFHLQTMDVMVTSGLQWNGGVGTLFEFFSSAGTITDTKGSLYCVLSHEFGWFDRHGTDPEAHMRVQNNVFYFMMFEPILLLAAVLCAYVLSGYLHQRKELGASLSWAIVVLGISQNHSLHYVLVSLCVFFYYNIVDVISQVFGCSWVEHLEGHRESRYLNMHPWYQCYPWTSPYGEVFAVSMVVLLGLVGMVVGIIVMMKQTRAEQLSQSRRMKLSISGMVSAASAASAAAPPALSRISRESLLANQPSEQTPGQREGEKERGKMLLGGSDEEEDEEDEESGQQQRGLSAITACYRFKWWWWEFFLMVRRVSLAAAKNSIPFNDTVLLSLFIFGILQIAIVLEHFVRPFKYKFDNQLMITSLYLLSLSYMIGLVASLTGNMIGFIDVTLAIAHVVFVFACLLFMFLDFARAAVVWEKKWAERPQSSIMAGSTSINDKSSSAAAAAAIESKLLLPSWKPQRQRLTNFAKALISVAQPYFVKLDFLFEKEGGSRRGRPRRRSRQPSNPAGDAASTSRQNDNSDVTIVE